MVTNNSVEGVLGDRDYRRRSNGSRRRRVQHARSSAQCSWRGVAADAPEPLMTTSRNTWRIDKVISRRIWALLGLRATECAPGVACSRLRLSSAASARRLGACRGLPDLPPEERLRTRRPRPAPTHGVDQSGDLDLAGEGPSVEAKSLSRLRGELRRLTARRQWRSLRPARVGRGQPPLRRESKSRPRTRSRANSRS